MTALRAVECEFRSDHARTDERLRQLESRADKQDEAVLRIAAELGEVKASAARIEGSIEGAFRAKKLSGAVLGLVVPVLASAVLGLLLFALKGG